jgi:glycosyltransferase involved in cell wall biosynthesis
MSKLRAAKDEVSSPTISIIIPAYNVARFIRETLDAVFAQTFTDYEAIIINDGSPDTNELDNAIQPFQDRIVYVKQSNRGAAAARNRGLEIARGEFVAFLDADDLWSTRYLEEQLNFLKSGGFDLVYADALIVGDSPLAGRTFMETAPSNGAVTAHSLLDATCNIITSGVVSRRDLILGCGGFDETLRNSHDFDLWVRLAKSGARLGYQRNVLLSYRCHDNSLSGDAINNVVRQIRVYEKILHSYELSPPEKSTVDRMLRELSAELELETARSHLLKNDLISARVALEKANEHYRKTKLSLMILCLRFAPRLSRGLYLRLHQKPSLD